MGVTRGPALEHAATRLDGVPEGAISEDGQVLATYCHGLFDSPAALDVLLEWAGIRPEAVFDPSARRERDIDRIADAVEQNLRLDLLSEWLPVLRAAAL
jgi:adenosylcobyric acid synthase